MKIKPIITAVGLTTLGTAFAANDSAQHVEQPPNAQYQRLMGVSSPLGSTGSGTERAPGQAATDQIAVAGGLPGEFATRKAANKADMLAFSPNDTEDTQSLTSPLISAVSNSRAA